MLIQIIWIMQQYSQQKNNSGFVNSICQLSTTHIEGNTAGFKPCITFAISQWVFSRNFYTSNPNIILHKNMELCTLVPDMIISVVHKYTFWHLQFYHL